MFCKNCGKEIREGNAFCTNCGAPQHGDPAPVRAQQADRQEYAPQYVPNAAEDGSSFGWATLGFFFPLVGLILFLVWKNTLPLRSKSCGIGALIGFIVGVVIGIVVGVIVGVGMAAALYSCVPALQL